MPKKSTQKAPAKKKSADTASGDLVELMKQQMVSLFEGNAAVPAGDVKALLASWEGPSVADGLSDEDVDARYQAQELAFDAMEAESEAQARKLAKRALRLDPDCVDALVVLLSVDAHSPREMIEGLQKAVAAGERSLGEKFIEENKGNFWLLLDTRPYMRALENLAGALRADGISLDAVKVYEKMLTLNPNDNQGVRDSLLGLYLEMSDLKGAGRLLKTYKKDASATFSWGRVMERLLAGDESGASVMLNAARKANRHFERYLTAQEALPEDLPEMYSSGSKEEAVLCFSFLGAALVNHVEASSWLFDQLLPDVPARIVSKKALLAAPIVSKKVQ